jgi:hypothetical protein
MRGGTAARSTSSLLELPPLWTYVADVDSGDSHDWETERYNWLRINTEMQNNGDFKLARVSQ